MTDGVDSSSQEKIDHVRSPSDDETPRKATWRSRLPTSGRIGAATGILGLFLAGVVAIFQVFGNINISGHWQAYDPRDTVGIDISGADDTAYIGCVHLIQKWPSGNVIGTIERELDELPSIIGTIEADRFSFEFLVFEIFDGEALPEYGQGTLVQVDYQGEKALSGIWHQIDSGRKRAENKGLDSTNEKGRWLLLPSEKTCDGKMIPRLDRPPFGKWTSLARWLSFL